MPTPTVENYLKALYTLGQQAGADLTPTGALADRLQVAPGTATLMIQRLAERGLVHYEPRQGARLTRSGQKAALDVLRRHRLIELFLVKVVGLDWSEVHEEAEVLEHAISNRLLQRIDDMLGNPDVDPHGDPIPAASGKMIQRRLVELAQCEPGKATIARITDHSPDFLHFLDRHELGPDTQVTVSGRDAAADTITLRHTDGRTIQLGSSAASKILVVAG